VRRNFKVKVTKIKLPKAEMVCCADEVSAELTPCQRREEILKLPEAEMVCYTNEVKTDL